MNIKETEKISKMLNKCFWQIIKGELPCRNTKKTK